MKKIREATGKIFKTPMVNSSFYNYINMLEPSGRINITNMAKLLALTLDYLEKKENAI